MTKICPKCGIEKELNGHYWYRNMSKPDGWSSICRPCKKEIDLIYIRSVKGTEVRNAYIAEGKKRAANRLWRRNSRNESYLHKRENKRTAKIKEHDRKFVTDAYVRQLLRGAGIENPTPEQIEWKRIQVKLKRDINQFNKELKNESACSHI